MADSYNNNIISISTDAADGTPISLLPTPTVATDPSLHQLDLSVSENQNQHEEEMKSHDSGDEYSSGSDRSVEVDDTEDGRGDSGSGGGANEDNANCPGRRRRKKRHGSHGSRRHKGGSRHKHRSTFQPYPGKDELSSSLKRKSLELQEKENAAAVLRRDETQEQLVTFPVAPFNSTQFLMDEHSSGVVGSPKGLSRSDSNLKLTAQDPPVVSSVPTTPRDGNCEINLFHKDKEFADIYSSVHAENLQSMPKEELVKHYMSLEEQVATLRKKVAEVQQQKVCDSHDSDGKLKLEMDVDKDSVAGSDTNSLSSANEEFVDLTSVNHHMTVIEGQNDNYTSCIDDSESNNA